MWPHKPVVIFNFIGMENALDLIEQDPEFFNRRPPISEWWEQVRTQAMRHMMRLDKVDLFDIVHPNESDEIRAYRDSVRRDITTEGPWKFISKVSRIFVESGIVIEETSLSAPLQEWLESMPFESVSRNIDLQTWAYEWLLPATILDPNGILIPWPVNPINKNVAPAAQIEDGGLPPTERVYINPVIISSADVVFLSTNVCSWLAGMMTVILDKKSYTKPYYIVVDRDWYYQYVPYKIEHGKIIYRLVPWYFHNIGSLPVENLGGVLTEAPTVSKSTHIPQAYFESFLRTYFELSDEVVIAFSQDQAVRSQHAYPKMVLSQIPCMEEGCERGKMKVRDNQGKIIDMVDCQTCGGSGMVKNPGPYHTLLRPNAAVNPAAANAPILEYVTPPSDTLQQSYNVPWDILTKAKRTIGLDLLLNEGVESGKAKLLRLDDLHDILRMIASSFWGVIERFLGHAESLLVVQPDRRSDPSVKVPDSLNFKDSVTLKEEAETALPVDRYKSTMDYIRKVYETEQELIRVYELALQWAPLLLSNDSEIRTGLSSGAYTGRDIQKRDMAFMLISRVAARSPRFMELSLEQVFDQADELLNQLFPPAPINNGVPLPGSVTEN